MPSDASAEGPTIRVVIDLNLFVASLLGSSTVRAILTALAEGAFTLICSPLMVRDLREVVTRPKFRGVITPEVTGELLEFLETHARLLTPRHPVQVCRDLDDDHVLSLAVEGGASVIVSRDKDLTSLGSYSGVSIVTPAEFLAWLSRHPA